MRIVTTLLLLATLSLAPVRAARAYTLQLSTGSPPVQRKWATTNITIAFSTSLTSPPSNIKAGSDVVGAARRALQHWARASNIKFSIVNVSEDRAISDGLNIITVSASNSTLFTQGANGPTGRAFVRRADPSNPNTITEADLAINPFIQFSTDGTFGTYDLESTFTHEIGHMLGLEHSGIVGATMQPRQALNGTFDLPAIRRRTLSHDDRAGIRTLYGPTTGLGELRGTVRSSGNAVFGAHVFAEDVATGRAVAGNVTLPDGSYQISSLPPGDYRVVVEPLNEPVAAREIATQSGAYQGLTGALPTFRTFERTAPVTVAENQTTALDVALDSLQPTVNPVFVGTNFQLSTTPVPVVPGTTITVLVGGDNIHSVASADVSITSPYFTIDRSSFQQTFFTGPSGQVPVTSFRVTVSVLTAPGDYSIRLARRNAGSGAVEEIAYLSGALTMDLPNGVTTGPNLVDNSQFFVAQHYRDFLLREPDAAGLNFWTSEIESCGSNAACREDKRINVSAAFFLSIEFQQTGYFVYRVYKAAFGNLPGLPVPVRLQPFFADTERVRRGVIVGVGNWEAQLETNKRDYVLEVVNRPEFVARYPLTLSAVEFVDALNANAGGVLSADERNRLIAELAPNPSSAQLRASVLRQVAEDSDLNSAEFNRAFVLMQYFGYLRRNPDDPPDNDFAGFNFWLGKLNQFGGNFIQAEMVKAFLVSTEYRARFGPP